MKTTRLFSSLFVLAMAILLAVAPFGRVVAQSGPVTGEPVTQPAQTAPSPTPPGIVLDLAGCARANLAALNDYYEQRVVELTNIERANNGQPPLKRNADLDYAARFHAKDMADDGYFAHDSYDGQGGTVKVCDWNARVSNYLSGWTYLAENIAAGYASSEDVVNGWINSPGHHTNMISPNYREIGVGYYAGGKWGKYWVQDFAIRSGVYPLVINNDAYAANSNQVSIYLYGQGTWAEMRLSNDGANWTAWQPFRSSFSWRLPCNLGTYTVYAQMRAAGHVNADTSAKDSIVLQGSTCPTFGKLPTYAAFLYDQSTKELIPSSYTYQPGNTSSPVALNWSAAKSGFSTDWLSLSATNGSTPSGTLTVTPVNFASLTHTAGDYTGTLTLSATSTSGEPVNNATVTIRFHLVVVPKVMRVDLPGMGR